MSWVLQCPYQLSALHRVFIRVILVLMCVTRTSSSRHRFKHPLLSRRHLSSVPEIQTVCSPDRGKFGTGFAAIPTIDKVCVTLPFL